MSVDSYLKKCGTIPGWMSRTDGVVFEALSAWQVEAGLAGDFLEIGAYHGRSAILMGYLLRPGEQLHLCDLFEDQPGPGPRVNGARHYARVSQAGTLANYARYHATPPVVHHMPSTELLPRARLAPPVRFMHIDGSHQPHVMREDLATARHLLVPGGIVVFEDDHSVHSPGVPPAVRAAFEDGSLSALALSPSKTYALAGPDTHDWRGRLAAWAATSSDVRPRPATFAGQPVVLLYPLPDRVNPGRGLERKAGLR